MTDKIHLGMGVVWTLVLIELFACRTPVREFEIRRRDPNDRAEPAAQVRAYGEEFVYVRARRAQLDGARPDVQASNDSGAPSNLIGLALSGGGIRSATFGLGFLQGLQRTEVLDQIDYTSAVSGGGYIAGWQQAHLGAHPAIERDHLAFLVGARSPEDLLRNHDDHIEQLRTHSGFLNQGGWIELPKIVWQWLWRWPFHIVLDDLIHLRGVFTFQHIFPIYRERIEGTYYRGIPPSDVLLRPISETRLVDMNAAGSEKLTPYLILNANLSNRGRSRVHVSYPQAADAPRVGDSWSFEFTRDFVGSDATGYVASGGFGLPVEEVEEGRALDWKKGKPPHVPRRVVVKLKDAEKSPFRLSAASSAAGAAFDSLAAARRVGVPVVSEGMHLLGGAVLNLNLGLDVPNFAREYDGAWTAWDYTRMFTYQRVPRHTDPGARWLHITDGGHYENLGVYALLRRGTRCVISVDAGADPDGSFEDLWILSRRVSELGFRWSSRLPDQQNAPHYRFELTDAEGAVRAVVLLVKASADARFAHMVEYSDEVARKVAETSVKTVSENLVDAMRNLRIHLVQDLEGMSVRYTSVADGLSCLTCPLATLGELAQVSMSTPEADEKAIKELRRRLDEVEASHGLWSAELKQLRARRLATAPPLDPSAPEVEPAEPAAPPRAEGDSEDAKREQALHDSIAAAANERTRLEGEISKLKLSSERLEAFKRRVGEAATALAKSLQEPGIGMTEDVSMRWADRFDVALVRGGERLYELSQANLDAEASQTARNDRIRRIRAYSRLHPEYPHTPTVRQWYEWEDFEAYRLLGVQMSTTYLQPLSPPDSSSTSLGWCDFPKRFATDPMSGDSLTWNGAPGRTREANRTLPHARIGDSRAIQGPNRGR